MAAMMADYMTVARDDDVIPKAALTNGHLMAAAGNDTITDIQGADSIFLVGDGDD